MARQTRQSAREGGQAAENGGVKGAPATMSSEGAARKATQRKRKNEGASAEDAAGVNSFEMERLEKIRANQERMRALSLPALVDKLAQVEATKRALDKGKAREKKRQKVVAREPQRQSLRSRGQAAEMPHGIKVERRTGVVLANAASAVNYPTVVPGAEVVERQKQPTGDQEWTALAGEQDSDAAFIAAIRDVGAGGAAAGSRRRGATEGAAGAGVAFADAAKMRLDEHNVAKVVHDGVVCLQFLPCEASSGKCVLAAGGRRGHVGFWICDPLHPEDKKCSALGEDGVVICQPHHQYVSEIAWLPGTSPKLLTCSYDGSVLMLDVEQQQFLLAYANPEDEYSAMGASLDGNSVCLADPQGSVRVVDVRAKSLAAGAVVLHNRKINSLHFQRGSGATTFASSSTDSSVCIWDIRKLGKKATPIATVQHQKSCHSAYFVPDGSDRVLSTSYDDTVRVWKGNGSAWSQEAVFKHNNQTGRWISPFRAVWSPDCSAVAMGDLKRAVAVFDLGNPKKSTSLTSEHMTAIPSRVCCHPKLKVVAAGTSSGRVHLWTG